MIREKTGKCTVMVGITKNNRIIDLIDSLGHQAQSPCSVQDSKLKHLSLDYTHPMTGAHYHSIVIGSAVKQSLLLLF